MDRRRENQVYRNSDTPKWTVVMRSAQLRALRAKQLWYGRQLVCQQQVDFKNVTLHCHSGLIQGPQGYTGNSRPCKFSDNGLWVCPFATPF